jgi:hypothetical protein
MSSTRPLSQGMNADESTSARGETRLRDIMKSAHIMAPKCRACGTVLTEDEQAWHYSRMDFEDGSAQCFPCLSDMLHIDAREESLFIAGVSLM